MAAEGEPKRLAAGGGAARDRRLRARGEPRDAELRQPHWCRERRLQVDAQGRRRYVAAQPVGAAPRPGSCEQLLQEQRRQQDLEQAKSELQAYSWRVAHELKAPVGRLQGFAAALRFAVGSALDERGSHYLGRIGALAQDIGDLVHGLLTLACDAQRALRPEPLDLSLMASEALATLLEAEPREALRVSIQPGLVAHADRALVRQVLANLLGNALKFTRGRLPARIEVGAGSAVGEEFFFVRDNGVGFDPALAGTLFQPLRRLHGGEYPGCGLGLATVARIVGCHGGRVWARATPGEGATFCFSLPAPIRTQDAISPTADHAAQ